MVDSNGPASRAELALLALALLGVPALVFYEWSSWHPGWARVDESSAILWIQRWQQGIEADLRATAGSFHHFLLASLSRAFGPSLLVLHIPQSAALLAECALLFSLTKEKFGSRAAVWALLCNLLCAFTLMRGRSLLSYSLLPLELLALWRFYGTFPSVAGQFAWGLLAGLVTLDYELWLYGAALAAAFALAGSTPWQKRAALAAGLALSLGLVAWLSADNLQSYFAVRGAKSAPGPALSWLLVLLGHLKDYFFGGPVFQYIGTSGIPVFPAWALPALIPGLWLGWKRCRWLLPWALLAFFPLAFRSPGLEPQRALLAWPALCILSGAGLARLSALAGRGSWALLALPLLGFGFELRAHARSMDGAWADLYGPSSAQMLAMEPLKKNPGPLLLSLDFHSSGPLRYFLASSKENQGPPVALIPMYAAAALKREQGRIEKIVDPRSGRDLLLFYPEGPSVERMRRRNSMLDGLWATLSTRDRFLRARQLRQKLDDPLWSDPWLRSVLWSEELEALHYIGRLEDSDIEGMLRESLPTAEPYRETALREGRRRPALGIRLMERAAQVDPRFPFTPELRAPLEYYLAQESKKAAP